MALKKLGTGKQEKGQVFSRHKKRNPNKKLSSIDQLETLSNQKSSSGLSEERRRSIMSPLRYDIDEDNPRPVKRVKKKSVKRSEKYGLNHKKNSLRKSQNQGIIMVYVYSSNESK